MVKQSIQARIITDSNAMLWRLVGKLLLKACVPLLAIAGVLSYGVYLRGGDPGALWKSVAERGLGQFDRLFAGVQNDSSRAVGALSRSASAISGDQKGAGLTEVFTWKDADGITHYSTSRPDGVKAGTLSVDPNVNVLAPVRMPRAQTGAAQADSDDAQNDGAGEPGGRLPGVAGQVLAAREPAQATQAGPEAATGVDPAQLLRMLQAAEQ